MKRVITILTCCIFSFAFTIPAIAALETPPQITPFAEQTGYRYMYINGYKHKRLWSYTYDRWIDEYWIFCN